MEIIDLIYFYKNKNIILIYMLSLLNIGGSRKKRKSAKRKSVKRKSVKRKSTKRKSVKRKSVKRKSKKRKSVKRKSKKNTIVRKYYLNIPVDEWGNLPGHPTYGQAGGY